MGCEHPIQIAYQFSNCYKFESSGETNNSNNKSLWLKEQRGLIQRGQERKRD